MMLRYGFSRVRALILLIVVVQSLAAAEPEPDDPELQKLAAEAKDLFRQGVDAQRQGRGAEALEKFRRALTIHEQLYPLEKFPAGHASLAENLKTVGTQLSALGAPDKGLPYCERAVAMYHTLYPKPKYPAGHADLALALNLLSSLQRDLAVMDKALQNCEASLAMRQRLYPQETFPDGHIEIAFSLNSLGFLLHAMGATDQARTYCEQSLAMRQALYPASKYPRGHPDLTRAMGVMAGLLQSAGLHDQALQYSEQALAMTRGLYPEAEYPNGHAELARDLNNLASVLRDVGAHDKALQHGEQVLTISQALYPREKFPAGHPNLALAHANLVGILHSLRSPEQALPHAEQALAMYRTLYPPDRFPAGHPDLSTALCNYAFLLKTSRAYDKAIPLHEEALTMRRNLYPQARYPAGHPDLALSLNDLALLHLARGMPADGLTYGDDALTMRRALYPATRFPSGHSELAASLLTQAILHWASGRPERGLALCHEAVAMYGSLTDRNIATASESDALAFVRAQPLVRDTLLSLARSTPIADGQAYGSVWTTKASVTRVLERRHAAARAAGTESAAALSRLADLRRQTERLLQSLRLPPADRDRQLAALADERNELERTLARQLPVLEHWKQRDRLGPDDLSAKLPARSAFIDFVRYRRIEYDRGSTDQATQQRLTPCYLAFVLVPGQPIRRVDLGPIEPIDAAVLAWRKAIEENETAANLAAAQLQSLLWARLMPFLPRGTQTIFLSPDGELARLPWAALPGSKPGSVLLEDHALAVVPHGQFLLEQILFPEMRVEPSGRVPETARTEVERTLILAAVDYGQGSWPKLPGTATELQMLKTQAGTRPVVDLTETNATAARLRAELPQAGYAHFATHGFFAEKELAEEKKHELEAVKNWQFTGASGGARPTAAKNPLGFVGLVLAQSEVLTGLSLVDLPLSNLQLVTLSACETGLGEQAGGEGVFGLQRAFHLAGAHNVVASLWKVNDAATSALMTKFYHELWINKRPPIEALREAQLTIYRRPDLIPDLVGERGAPNLKKAVEVKVADSIPNTANFSKSADTRLWAAFVLSGMGK